VRRGDRAAHLGGFVAKYMGDGVLVYFGYPQAHEDDAERAVRAGLELVAAVSALKTHSALQTRVGIATGLVVVGDLIGSGASQEQAIVGETPNLAARLQGVAEPNSVVIAESTRKLVGNLFELQELGAQDLKGIVGSVQAWAALRPSFVESRFEAFHAGGLTELVGREEEVELLLRRWAKARSGEGQLVLLSGEPGIGKSRLTAALMERLALARAGKSNRHSVEPQMTVCIKTGMQSEYKIALRYAAPDVQVLSGQWTADKLDGHIGQDCKAILSFGLCGGLIGIADVGRGFVCYTLKTPDGDFIADPDWSIRLQHATGYMPCRWWSSGQFNTANDAEQRYELYQKTGAWVIDDETYAVAQFAKKRGIAFQALRIVSDSINDKLPPAVVDALNNDGTDNIMAVIESVEHNPFQIPALIKTALEYGKSLAELRGAAIHVGSTFCWQ
jgi:nucleoside phosphorylase